MTKKKVERKLVLGYVVNDDGVVVFVVEQTHRGDKFAIMNKLATNKFHASNNVVIISSNHPQFKIPKIDKIKENEEYCFFVRGDNKEKDHKMNVVPYNIFLRIKKAVEEYNEYSQLPTVKTVGLR